MPILISDKARCPSSPNARICLSYSPVSTRAGPRGRPPMGLNRARLSTILSWPTDSTRPSAVHTLPITASGPNRRLPTGLSPRHRLTVPDVSRSPARSDAEYCRLPLGRGCV